MDGAELWFGTLNGISVVYDPDIQVSGSRWVLLFAVPHQRLIPYQSHTLAASQSRCMTTKRALPRQMPINRGVKPDHRRRLRRQ